MASVFCIECLTCLRGLVVFRCLFGRSLYRLSYVTIYRVIKRVLTSNVFFSHNSFSFVCQIWFFFFGFPMFCVIITIPFTKLGEATKLGLLIYLKLILIYYLFNLNKYHSFTFTSSYVFPDHFHLCDLEVPIEAYVLSGVSMVHNSFFQNKDLYFEKWL